MSSYIKYLRGMLRLPILKLLCLALICLIQFTFYTHIALAQTTYNEPYGMIQLADIPTPDQRTELSDAGIILGNYASNLTWDAKFDSPIDVDQLDLIISINSLEPSRKLSPLFPAPTDEIGFSFEEVEVLVMLWNSNMTSNLTQ